VFSTCFVENGVTLSSIFGKVRVNKMNEIVSDWGGEYGWSSNAISNFFSVIALVH
jgi:hypothetical protein